MRDRKFHPGMKAVVAACFSLCAAAAHGLEPDAIFERVAPSVWIVRALDANEKPIALGSAVVIGPQRLVTNCHVLTRAVIIQVRKGNQTFGSVLENPDPERDLCQLRVPDFTAPAVAIGTINALKVGQRVYAIGNPRGLELTMSEGIVSSLRRLKEETPVIQTTAPISRGSSGGGLFDSEGRLVGITTFLLRDSQNLNFALPSDWIAEMSERSREQVAKFRSEKEAQARSSSTAPTGAPPAEKMLQAAELTQLFSGYREIKVSEPQGLEKVTFYDGGNVSVHLSNAMRGGTREVRSPDNQLCLKFFVDSRNQNHTFPLLNDCFTVSRTAEGKYRFTAVHGKFMFIGDL